MHEDMEDPFSYVPKASLGMQALKSFLSHSECEWVTVQPDHGREVQIRNGVAPLLECLQECTKESSSLLNERMGLQVIIKKYKLEDNEKLGITKLNILWWE